MSPHSQPRRRGSRRRAMLLGLLVLGLGVPAWAHGPAPAALEVLSVEGARPALVRTNIGLAAARQDGTYAYVCPSRWDDNERALALSAADRTWVQSAGVAYRADPSRCRFEPITEEGFYVTSMAELADGVLLVGEPFPDDPDPGRSELRLVPAEGSTRLFEVEAGAIDGVTADNGVWLSGHAPQPFVSHLDADGAVTPLYRDELRLADRWVPRAVDRRGEAVAVWVLETLPEGLRLLRVSAGGLEEGPTHQVVHGPVWLSGAWVALFDGVLHRWSDEGWAADGERDWTCLREEGGHVYACALDRLLRLDGDGELDWFSMSQIAAPEDCADAEQQRACQANWAHFGGESGWLDTDPANEPGAMRRPPGGCGVSPGG